MLAKTRNTNRRDTDFHPIRTTFDTEQDKDYTGPTMCEDIYLPYNKGLKTEYTIRDFLHSHLAGVVAWLEIVPPWPADSLPVPCMRGTEEGVVTAVAG